MPPWSGVCSWLLRRLAERVDTALQARQPRAPRRRELELLFPAARPVLRRLREPPSLPPRNRRARPCRSATPPRQRHPGARHGRGRAGEVRPSRHAHGHGRRRHRAVDAIPQPRPAASRLARPRPLRALGRPRLDAALRAAVPHRLPGHDARRAAALPPARARTGRPSRVRPRPRHRDHDRARSARASPTRSAWRWPSATWPRASAASSSITTPRSSPATAA